MKDETLKKRENELKYNLRKERMDLEEESRKREEMVEFQKIQIEQKAEEVNAILLNFLRDREMEEQKQPDEEQFEDIYKKEIVDFKEEPDNQDGNSHYHSPNFSKIAAAMMDAQYMLEEEDKESDSGNESKNHFSFSHKHHMKMEKSNSTPVNSDFTLLNNLVQGTNNVKEAVKESNEEESPP
eukprot:CAMPEP_0170550466 /NCGR_PEP_ID=MMETSP0211-20121228/8530_1 /TAXON_ID=311385 /ORGANISM="Pseudokeronopsis sp., Strain OXSARD2" /LENGTH=182 /DNA_ID=CAMNT_0010857039 /DNA_START=532 /DNA_END=1080 /DNA_ORIENTATION=-